MSDAPRSRDVQGLWQGQPVDGGLVPLDELRSGSRRLERVIRRRNRREYAAAAFVVFGFGGGAWFAHHLLIRVGAGLAVPAALFIAYHLHRWGTARPMPEQMALTGSLQFHRSELARQRDLLQSVAKWGLLPLLPSFVVLTIGFALSHPERLWRQVSVVVFVAVVTTVIWLLNRRAADRIQARIDALENDV